jgi:benzoate-CoA ligase
MLAHLDTIDFPSVFLGAIKAGIVPVAANTLLTTADYKFMLEDSRARALVVSEALLPSFAPILREVPSLKHVIVSGKDAHGHLHLQALMAKASATFSPAPTTSDDVCFWLYSSGSTGTPKGTVHVHSSLIQTAELYARPILGIRESDVVFSAAKLFFAYGLGNALTFPLSVGATAVLMGERPTAVFKRLQEHRDHLLQCPDAVRGVPDLPRREAVALRICTSAGEALPADIGRRWTERFSRDSGWDRLDRDAAHLPSTCRAVRYGTTDGSAWISDQVDGRYGQEVGVGELGDYRSASRQRDPLLEQPRQSQTFVGWTRAGDKYTVDEDGYYTYSGLPRHAQGQRHVRLAVRGRGSASYASRRARGCCDRRARRPATHQTQGFRGDQAGRAAWQCAVRSAQAARQGQACALQVSALGRISPGAAQNRHRQDSTLQAACAGIRSRRDND